MKYLKYFFQFLIIVTLFSIFRLIGYKNASNFGAKIGGKFGKLIRSDEVILKNINIINDYSQVKFQNINEITKKVFSNYGRILAEYVYLEKFRNGSLKNNVNIKGQKYLNEILLKNKKVIFISGHFNNFELMAMFIDSAGINLAAIYRPLNNIFLNKIMEKLRRTHICKNQIQKGKSGTRQILKYLKNNFSIALMIDQRVTEGIKSDFFGKPAYTTTIPAQIVKKFDCEVVPIFIERVNDTNFDLTINEPIKFEKDSSVELITLKLNKILENMVLKNPSQWILTHNRWK